MNQTNPANVTVELFDRFVDPVVIIDRELNIIYSNGMFSAALGMSERRVKKKKIDQLLLYEKDLFDKQVDLVQFAEFKVSQGVQNSGLRFQSTLFWFKNSDGAANVLIMFNRNLTMRENLNEKVSEIDESLKESQTELKQSRTELVSTKRSLENITFIVLSVIVTFSFAAGSITAIHFPPILVTGFRFLLVGIVLSIVFIIKGTFFSGVKSVKDFSIITFCVRVYSMAGTYWALKYIPSGMVAVFMTSNVVWSTLIGGIWTKTWPSKATLVSMGIGFIAILFFCFSTQMEMGSFVPIVVLLTSTMLFSFGNVYRGKKIGMKFKAVEYCYELLVGGVILILASLAIENPTIEIFENIPKASYIGLIYLVVFLTFLGDPAIAWLASVMSPSRASSFFFIQPIGGIIAGVLVANEKITINAFIFFILILVSVSMIFKQRKE